MKLTLQQSKDLEELRESCRWRGSAVTVAESDVPRHRLEALVKLGLVKKTVRRLYGCRGGVIGAPTIYQGNRVWYSCKTD